MLSFLTKSIGFINYFIQIKLLKYISTNILKIINRKKYKIRNTLPCQNPDIMTNSTTAKLIQVNRLLTTDDSFAPKARATKNISCY